MSSPLQSGIIWAGLALLLAMTLGLTQCSKAGAPPRWAKQQEAEGRVSTGSLRGEGPRGLDQGTRLAREDETVEAPSPAEPSPAAPPPDKAQDEPKDEALRKRSTVTGAVGLGDKGGQESGKPVADAERDGFADSAPAALAAAAPVQAEDDAKALAVNEKKADTGRRSIVTRSANLAPGKRTMDYVGGGHGGYGAGQARSFGAGTLVVHRAVALAEAPKNTGEAEQSEDLPWASGGDAADVDACSAGTVAPAPLPRRCHLAPNYRAGQGIWQRRLQSLALLPPDVQALLLAPKEGAELVAPDTTALAVSARLDRQQLDGPGEVWMRVSLRSTDRWGMRRPPFDLAVVVGTSAAAAPDRLACRTLEALAQRIEPQDRLTLIRGLEDRDNLDGISGAEALSRVRAVCAGGAQWAQAPLSWQHQRARTLLAQHASAQHRVAGSRLILLIAAAADLSDPRLQASVTEAVAEPTLSSVLVLDESATSAGWELADLGHGILERVGGEPDRAASNLWHNWGRVVARLVRVDLRLAPGVVALRVVGSRVLDQVETQRVRRQERAVDNNLARVAGVRRDRETDGEGMTMLIPAFLGSDEHVIDVQLSVPGPGPVADVVVDYKDLVRMSNQKAMARASLTRLARSAHTAAAGIARPDLDQLNWAQAGALRQAVARRDGSSIANIVEALQAAGGQAPLVELGQAMQTLVTGEAPTEALLAALDVFVARGRGCHVAALLQ